MFVEFEKLSPTARVWVYQLNRKASQQEAEIIKSTVKSFCAQWQAHGAPLITSYQIAYHQFLILAVDEQAGGASGCSIDGSVHLLKKLGAQLDIDFFDRTSAAFLNNGEVVTHPLTSLKELFASGMLKSTDTTFNNLVPDKAALANEWQVQVSKSWLAKYLPKSALA